MSVFLGVMSVIMIALAVMLLLELRKASNNLKKRKFDIQELVKSRFEGEIKGMHIALGIAKEVANTYGKTGMVATLEEKYIAEINAMHIAVALNDS